MTVSEIIAFCFIGFGMVIFLLSTLGLFRYKYVLNRMHIAAQSDTLGLLSIAIGAIIINGIGFNSLKILVILVIFWMSGPVSSHVIARMEIGSLEDEDRVQFTVEDRQSEEEA